MPTFFSDSTDAVNIFTDSVRNWHEHNELPRPVYFWPSPCPPVLVIGEDKDKLSKLRDKLDIEFKVIKSNKDLDVIAEWKSKNKDGYILRLIT